MVSALLLVAGCANETAVYVVIDAQDLGRVRASVLSVRAFGPDGEAMLDVARFPLDDAPLPRVIRLTPSNGDASRRWVLVAQLEREDGSIVNENRLVGGFVQGATRHALLCVEDSCLGAACGGAPDGCDPNVLGSACEGCSDGLCARIEAELLTDGAGIRCPPRPPPPEAMCGDAADNDADGLIDCADEDCERRPCSPAGDACVGGECICLDEATETNCGDGLDEDCNGAIDCADAQCEGMPCDDGLACTTGEVCTDGACVGLPTDCDDGIPCTIDRCDDDRGCVNTPNDSMCDDRILCTTDVCSATDGCVIIPDASRCDDHVLCTEDACVRGIGCVNTSNDDLCDSDRCNYGVCRPPTGCQLVPHDGIDCDDGNPCTDGDVCSGGTCSGTKKNCDDGMPCTDDYCDGGVCRNSPLPQGTACGTERTCCDGFCRWMGSDNHCGGCRQDCRGGFGCRSVPGVPGRFHCNCDGPTAECPHGQTCIQPHDESIYRCACTDDSQCRFSNNTCRTRSGTFNYCAYDE